MSKLKNLRLIALGLAFAFSSAVPAFTFVLPAAASTVVAKVNGVAITDEDVKLAGEDLGPAIPKQLQGKARDAYILDYLIDGQLVAQKAVAEKLDQTPDFPQKLAYYKEKLLMEALLSQTAKSAATDEAMKKVYDDAAKNFKPQDEIHARHILVATKEEAEAALKRVKGGEDFAKVAKEVSKDPGSDGGDLGWFTKDRMIPEFAEAAFKLQVGQISDPVKTQFGWHIIKVEGKRQTKFPPFDQVKEQLSRYVVQKAQADLIAELHKSAKIERLDGGSDAKTDPKTAAPATPATPATPAAPAAPAKK
jgi:peptidyl-prolyl cis-trans isomerase C